MINIKNVLFYIGIRLCLLQLFVRSLKIDKQLLFAERNHQSKKRGNYYRHFDKRK